MPNRAIKVLGGKFVTEQSGARDQLELGDSLAVDHDSDGITISVSPAGQPCGAFPSGANRIKTVELVEHFTSASGLRGLTTSVSGTGAAVNDSAADNADQVGMVQVETGTTTTGRAAVISGASAIRSSAGRHRLRWDLRLGNLSDGTETYTIRAGFIDSASGESTDGCFFRYTHSVNSGRWEAVTRSNGTETGSATDTGIAASTSWVVLEIEINTDSTSVKFYINGTLVATNTTNIPGNGGASGREFGIGTALIKSAGTTNRLMLVDLMAYAYDRNA